MFSYARHAAITIDVDSLAHYRAIHGLGEITISDDPIYTIAMPRFWELVESIEARATLFLIGADAPNYPEAFAPVKRTGSEVASHSYSHDYRLTTRSATEIADDLRRADEVLRPLNDGRPLVGFRAPGYNTSPSLLRTVADLGYRYDSSFMPSPMYFAARWAAIEAYKRLGRPSRSLRGPIRQFVNTLRPHRIRPHAPYSPSKDGSLVELPIACEPLTRAPLIGTSWSVAPRLVQKVLLESTLRNLDCFVFEMHAIDLLDEGDHPLLRELASSQRDLRVPIRTKLDAFARLFETMATKSTISTLAEISENY